MPHILKNENLEVHIDHPTENYQSSRFDWTGKIASVKFQGIPLTIFEKPDGSNEFRNGKGLYNEFGMDGALGFEEAEIGGWFHKIGVGLLKKDNPQYQFNEPHEILPATFVLSENAGSVTISCTSSRYNGYSYFLRKEIVLRDSSIAIKYHLENTGEKDIITDEYNHNFLAIDQDLIGSNYVLKFPFELKPNAFLETVNPAEVVKLGQNEITFWDKPQEQFFFSNLTGGENELASWELINPQNNIGIREVGSFKTDKVNLWGWTHVVSPELFFKISLQPGQSIDWSRKYEVFRIN